METWNWYDSLPLWIGWTLEVLYLGVVVGTVLMVLLNNRNPVKTIAWILVLVFLPFVGLLFYFFFGRDRRHIRIIGRRSYNRLLRKPMAEYVGQNDCTLPIEYERPVHLFRQTNQALLFDGNDLKVYTEGRSKLRDLLADLERATQHIHMEYYIIEDDEVGRAVSDVLIRKASRGVIVRLIYDDVGCWRVSKHFFDTMRRGGVEVRPFLEVRFPSFTGRVNYRNHRKIVVIDGCVGYVGGMNLAHRYVEGLPWGTWRDTHLRLEGRAVHGLQTAFLLDWYFVDRTLITDRVYFPHLPNRAGALVQVVTGEPIGPWKELMQGFVSILSSAREYVYLQTPYFLPTEPVLAAMQTAALSGVDVRLMLPERDDTRLVYYASCSYLKDVLQAGVKVYLYRPGFLHSKLMVVDDKLATVGTANIDFRSFEHNFEVNAFIYDATEAIRLRHVFLADQQESRRVRLRSWERRPWHRKAIESFIRLLSPLL